jgi:hypothetical protein
MDAQQGYYSAKNEIPTLAQKVDVQGQPKKRALVLNFWNDTPEKLESLGAFAADELRRGLSLTQRIIFPLDVRPDASTENFLEGEQIKVAQLVREGRRLGVSVVAVGRIRKIVFRQKGDDVGLFRQKQSLVAVELEMKLFDVQAGREVVASVKYGEASADAVVLAEDTRMDSPAYRSDLIKKAVRAGLADFIPEMITFVEKMKWQGRIAKVSGQRVFVNAGRVTGLMTGDILSVMTLGEEVYDPDTGSSLGRAAGRLKGTLEVLDFVGPDAAVANIHTGGDFKEGDAVQLY